MMCFLACLWPDALPGCLSHTHAPVCSTSFTEVTSKYVIIHLTGQAVSIDAGFTQTFDSLPALGPLARVGGKEAMTCWQMLH